MLSIKHLTRYCYARELKSGVQQLRLTPLKSKFQKIRNWNVGLRGGRETLSYTDQFGNQTRFVEIVDGASEIEVEIEGEIDVIDNAGMLGVQKEAVPLWVYLMETPLTRAGKKLRAFMNVKFPDGALESLHLLSEKIREELDYADCVSKVGWSSEDVLTCESWCLPGLCTRVYCGRPRLRTPCTLRFWLSEDGFRATDCDACLGGGFYSRCWLGGV
jgi:hypothetical protein